MTAWAHMRGHPVRHDGDCWRYCDTGEPAEGARPCIACGLPPTPEGYDGCMGYVPGAVSACCGHGVEEPHVLTTWGRRWLRVRWAVGDALDAALRWACALVVVAGRVLR